MGDSSEPQPPKLSRREVLSSAAISVGALLVDLLLASSDAFAQGPEIWQAFQNWLLEDFNKNSKTQELVEPFTVPEQKFLAKVIFNSIKKLANKAEFNGNPFKVVQSPDFLESAMNSVRENAIPQRVPTLGASKLKDVQNFLEHLNSYPQGMKT